MKNDLLKSLLVVSVVSMLVGCGSGSSVTSGVDGEVVPDAPVGVDEEVVPDAPVSILSQELKDSITYMYNEEGLAYDVYMNIYKVQPVNQLQNIAMNSETKHIEEVNNLAIKYDLNMTQYPDTDVPYSIEGIGDGNYSVEPIQDLYTLLYDKGINSRQDALEVGCMVEVVDIDDLDEYIELAEESNASDVLAVFNILISGSYKHYWTFHDALIGMGVADGCCEMAKDLGHETCPTYPRN
ncbi:MAG: DUF2202 domain-containing protein [Sulfurovum sp.]